MKKRILALLLAAVTLLGTVSLVACGGGTPAVTTDPSGAPTTTDAPTTTEPACPIPAEDYDGHEFTVLEGGFSLVVFTNDFAYDENEATVLDAAVHRRNSAVEERLGITISTVQKICNGTSGSPEGYGALVKEKTSGDTNFDCAVLPAFDQTLLGYQGDLYDMLQVDTMDFKNTWWDEQAVNALTIKDMLFFATGDFSIDIFDATIVMLFNKEIAKEKSIGDLYQLVNDGKWTFEKWKELTCLVSDDLNADDKWTDQDRYGAAVWDDAVYAAVHCSGERCCKLDDSGNLVLTLGTERAISSYTDYVEFALRDYHVIRYQQTYNAAGVPKNDAGSKLETELFLNDQALFLFTWLGVANKFRDMDTDYGILPVFKYTEDQDSYYCTVAPYNTRFLSMPYLQEDAERTGIILETIGFYSQKYVMPAYYEKTLYGKTIRDEESRPMLELIRKVRVFDLGYFYQPADINKNLIYLFRANATNWASKYSALEKAAKKKLNTINAAFDKIYEQDHQ